MIWCIMKIMRSVHWLAGRMCDMVKYVLKYMCIISVQWIFAKIYAVCSLTFCTHLKILHNSQITWNSTLCICQDSQSSLFHIWKAVKNWKYILVTTYWWLPIKMGSFWHFKNDTKLPTHFSMVVIADISYVTIFPTILIYNIDSKNTRDVYSNHTRMICV